MPENVDELNMLVPSLSSHIPLFIESFCHQTPVPDSVPGVTSSAQLQASTQHGSNSIEKSVEKPAVSTLLSIPATSSAASVSPSRSPEKNSSDSKSTDFDPLFDESRSSIPVEPKVWNKVIFLSSILIFNTDYCRLFADQTRKFEACCASYAA
jgi:hypothetical protein